MDISLLSDEELKKQLSTALNWKQRERALQAESIKRAGAEKICVEIECPACKGSGKTGQPHGGDPFDTTCSKCNGDGYIRGCLRKG